MFESNPGNLDDLSTNNSFFSGNHMIPLGRIIMSTGIAVIVVGNILHKQQDYNQGWESGWVLPGYGSDFREKHPDLDKTQEKKPGSKSFIIYT